MAKKATNRAVSGVLSTTDSSFVKKQTPMEAKRKELAQQLSDDSTFQRKMQAATRARRTQAKVKPI